MRKLYLLILVICFFGEKAVAQTEVPAIPLSSSSPSADPAASPTPENPEVSSPSTASDDQSQPEVKKTNGVLLGLLAGGAFPVAGTAGNAQGVFAVEIGKEFNKSDNGSSVFFGAMIGASSITEQIAGITVTGTTILITAELLGRHLLGTPLYMGGRIGIAPQIETASETGVTATDTGVSFAASPVIGFDFNLNSNVLLGIDVSYLYISAGTASGATVFSYPSSKVLVTLASLKIEI
jgi:hypothetical protein